MVSFRWTPHPVIVTIRDNKDYIRVLLSAYCTTITGWGVLLKCLFPLPPFPAERGTLVDPFLHGLPFFQALPGNLGPRRGHGKGLMVWFQNLGFRSSELRVYPL